MPVGALRAAAVAPAPADPPDVLSAGVMTCNRTFNTSSGLVQAVAQLTDMPLTKIGRPTLRHVIADGAAAVVLVAVTGVDLSFGGAIARWSTGHRGEKKRKTFLF